MSFAIIFALACAWGMMSKHLFYKKGWNFHFPKADPNSFWGKYGYRNKYKQVSSVRTSGGVVQSFVPAPNNWYYRWNHLKYKERFPLSATLLVPLTDVHHAIQWLITRTLFVALAAPWDHFWQVLAVYVILWWIGFNITFLTRNGKH